MSQFKINSITNKNGNHGPVISGVSTNNSTGCMIIPSGNTGRRVEYNTVNDNDIVSAWLTRNTLEGIEKIMIFLSIISGKEGQRL